MTKSRYHKSEAIRELEVLANTEARRWHPTMPFLAPRRYQDNTANGLTKAIVDFLRLSGWQVERTSNTGRYLDHSKIVTDITGIKRRIGNGKWIRGSGQKGTSDISATIRGRSVKIEVKMKDKQSPDQQAYQQAVERAGGLYWLVRSFDEFINILKKLQK